MIFTKIGIYSKNELVRVNCKIQICNPTYLVTFVAIVFFAFAK